MKQVLDSTGGSCPTRLSPNGGPPDACPVSRPSFSDMYWACSAHLHVPRRAHTDTHTHPDLLHVPGLCSLSTCAHSRLPPLPQVLPQSPSPELVPCSAPWCPAWLWQGVGIASAGIKRDFSQFELCPSHCLQMQPCGHHIFTKCAKKKRCLARSCRAEEYQGGCARWQAWLLQPLMGAPARAASAREKLAGMVAWAGGAGGLVGYNLLPGWASPTPRPHSPDSPRGGKPCGASFLLSFLS